jgi:hypothetical protein
MNKILFVCLMLITVCSLILTACNISPVRKTRITSTVSSTDITTTLFTKWKSKMLDPDMIFEQGVAGNINGKNYLICSAGFGTSTNKRNSNIIIIVLDITNPDNPQEISSLKTEQEENPFICDMKLAGSFLYVLTIYNLRIIDLSDPYHLKEDGQMTFINASCFDISGEFAYVSTVSPTNDHILRTLDISDPMNPQILGQVSVPSYFNVMESSGSELFCLNFGGLYVYDKSIPGTLRQIGVLFNPFPPLTGVIPPESISPAFFDMAITGKNLYIASGIDRLLEVDISIPNAPEITTEFETREQATDIIISGGTAFLLACNGAIAYSAGIRNILAIVNIANKEIINEMNPVPLPERNPVSVPVSYGAMINANNYLYFCDQRYPLIQIVDINKLSGNLK